MLNIEENMTVTITDAKLSNEEDIILINRLDNETFKEHFNFRPRIIEETRYALLDSPWFQRQKWFFAVFGDQPVGHAGVGVDEGLNKEKNVKWRWILDIGILKPFRRKGIGKG